MVKGKLCGNGAKLWKTVLIKDPYKQVMQLTFIYYANQKPEKNIIDFSI